jgi:CheY-like chemotaxis protein
MCCGDDGQDLSGVTHVLIVDDEQPIRDVLADVFGLEGFSVATARDGLEALAAVRGHAPDAVVVDLMMPRMDGPTFLRAFRGIPAFASVPVVVISAVQAELDLATSLAHARRLKPFDVDDLVQTVRGLLTV